MRNHFSYNNAVLQFGLKQFGKFRETSFATKQNGIYKNILVFHQNNVRNFFTRPERNALGIKSGFQQKYSFKIDPDSANDIMRVNLEKYVPGNMLIKSTE